MRNKKEYAEALKKRITDLYKRGLKTSEIANIINLSPQYIRRIRKDLIFFNAKPKTKPNRGGGSAKTKPKTKPNFPKLGRKNVHGLMVTAYVHKMNSRYKKNPNEMYKDFREHVDVMTAGDLIYLTFKGIKFYGASELECYQEAHKFISATLQRLEQRLGVIIFKPKARAYQITKHEYETADSELAKDGKERKLIWRCFCNETGKLLLSCDRSDGFENHETYGKLEAHANSVQFQRRLNDWFKNPDMPLESELTKIVYALADNQLMFMKNVNAVVGGLAKMREQPPQEFKEDLEEAFYCG